LEDYKTFLENNKNKKFGLVFLDPPYKMKNVYNEIVDYMFDNDMLTDDCVIVKECDDYFENDDRFRKFKTYKYGIIRVSVYWR
jgi:16S rRNA G966 N2-methylase RsmD